jgi:hypothetical protein
VKLDLFSDVVIVFDVGQPNQKVLADVFVVGHGQITIE